MANMGDNQSDTPQKFSASPILLAISLANLLAVLLATFDMLSMRVHLVKHAYIMAFLLIVPSYF